LQRVTDTGLRGGMHDRSEFAVAKKVSTRLRSARSIL
jgi:hypothetical protein